MKLLVGLGNPGTDYALNRHNIGFMAVDAIADAHGFGPWRSKFQGQVSEGKLDGEKCLLLKPSTFMNESGRSAADAVRFYKLDLGDVIVLHDELDLAPGKVRVKAGGGVAGHNGLKSLTKYIGNDYVRVRIGIGHPGEKVKVHSHVLKNFSKAEQAWVAPLLDAIASAAPNLVSGNEASFMNMVALATGSGKPPSSQRTAGGKKEARRHGEPKTVANVPSSERKDEGDAVPDGPFSRLRKLFGADNKKGQ